MSHDQGQDPGVDLRAGVALETLRDGEPLRGHVDGTPAILVRTAQGCFAVGGQCPHYGAPLADGLVVDGTIRCPWHHAAFELASGKVTRPPAFDALPCWDVEVRDGMVRVTSAATPARSATTADQAWAGAVVIIGGGAAGISAADTLRKEGHTGSITILDQEPDLPCDRPNLSKDYLAGDAPEEWIALRPEEWYRERDVTLVRGQRVAGIDPSRRTVQLEGGNTLAYDRLLLATGSRPVRLPIGAGQRIHELRTVADSRAIIAAAEQARSAVVFGASFIGLEVAASLRHRGLDVTVVAPEARPLERVLGPDVGAFIQHVHERNGVRFRLGQTAKDVTSAGAVLANGQLLPADLIVAGVGVRPAIELAEAAGLTVDNGIIVDAYLETSAPGIYAAGDVARWPDARSGAPLRVEHWAVAERQGQVAARNMLAPEGAPRARFDAVPFFWSRHHDVTIAYVGHAAAWDDVTIDGDLAGGDCTVTYSQGGRALAVATIGRDRAALAAEAAFERTPHMRAPHPPSTPAPGLSHAH